MQERVGTAFNLMDSFASGVLGILCVGHSPQEAFRELADALDFISRQVFLQPLFGIPRLNSETRATRA